MNDNNFSHFWFVIIYITGLCFLGAIIFMGALIIFGSQAYGMTPIPDTYKECIASDLPEHICEILYPPLNRQLVNWTLVPFP